VVSRERERERSTNKRLHEKQQQDEQKKNLQGAIRGNACRKKKSAIRAAGRCRELRRTDQKFKTEAWVRYRCSNKLPVKRGKIRRGKDVFIPSIKENQIGHAERKRSNKEGQKEDSVRQSKRLPIYISV